MNLRELLRVLRSLVLGETWVLPLAVVAAAAGAAAVRLVAGAAWFEDYGGPVVVVTMAAALGVALRPPRDS